MEKHINSNNTQKTDQTKKKKSVIGYIFKAFLFVIIFIIAVQIIAAEKYSAQVVVIDSQKEVGINPTNEKLDFGDLSPGTRATRYINLEAGGVESYVYLIKFGSISELIKVGDNGFYLKKGDQKKLDLNMFMPYSAPAGKEYKGYVWMFKIPKIW